MSEGWPRPSVWVVYRSKTPRTRALKNIGKFSKVWLKNINKYIPWTVPEDWQKHRPQVNNRNNYTVRQITVQKRVRVAFKPTWDSSAPAIAPFPASPMPDEDVPFFLSVVRVGEDLYEDLRGLPRATRGQAWNTRELQHNSQKIQETQMEKAGESEIEKNIFYKNIMCNPHFEICFFYCIQNRSHLK